MSNILKYLEGIGTKTESNIVKRWEDLGFLDGLSGDDNDKKATALLFEKTAFYLLDKKNKGEDFDIKYEILPFAIIRRIIGGVLKDETNWLFKGSLDEIKAKKKYFIQTLDYKYIIKKMFELFDSLEELIVSMNEDNEIDTQAETAREFCEIMIPAMCRKFKDCDVFIKQNGELIVFDKKIV